MSHPLNILNKLYFLGSVDSSLKGDSTPGGEDNLRSSQESLNLLSEDSITSMEMDFKEFGQDIQKVISDRILLEMWIFLF